MRKFFSLPSILIFAIIIIAGFFRLYNIATVPPGLYPDEAMNGNNALEALSHNPPEFKVFYPENNGREGLFINIQAISVLILGNEPWALRVVGSIFGIFTVLGIYFLAKELFRQNSELQAPNPKQIQNSNDKSQKQFAVCNLEFGTCVALLSAFFLATSFWHINFSRIGFRAIMAPFFLTWGIFFFLKSLRKCEASSIYEAKSVIFSILAGLAIGLGIYSYIAFRIMVLLIPFALILYWFRADWGSRKKFFSMFLITAAASTIVFMPLGIYFLENPQDFFGRTTQVSVMNAESPIKELVLNTGKTISMFFAAGDYNWRHNYAGKPELFWPVAILFGIGIVLGVLELIKKTKNAFQNQYLKVKNKEKSIRFPILFGWLILAALPVVFSNEGLPHALRAILMIPPAVILAGYGGIWLYGVIANTANLAQITRIRIIFPVIISLFFAYVIVETYNSYFVRWANNPNVYGAFAADYVKIGRELNALPLEMPKYVLVEAGGTDVRGIPMPAQTVMYITDTFTPEKQKEKNIFYVLPKDIDKIPPWSFTAVIK